ncbi:hypothetical protein AOB46_04340 [Chryseobacterium indologenes]|uniref:Prenyltransferase n=1 Tax=Chryseobacterium indologenes TaxID=253 RepID=A0A0N1KSS6_CHRID|nr:hypothetical protein AOB46_04340 [Chryseobacterium indologenes]
MGKNIRVLRIFYQKLLIPAVLFSLLVCFLSGSNIKNFGLGFSLILPLLHFFIYDIRLKGEYFFYANFGFSRRVLWILTLSLSLMIKLLSGI